MVKIQVGAIGWGCCVTGEIFVMGSLRASFMDDLIALKVRLIIMRRSNSLQRRVKKNWFEGIDAKDVQLVSRSEQSGFGEGIIY